MPPAVTTERRALLAKVHLGKKHLAMDEDAYRAMLARICKVDSAAKANDRDLVKVIEEMKAKGFRDGGFRASRRPDVRKIHALWGELRRLGALESPTKAALRAFCARQAGLKDQAATDPEFLTADQARAVIEALKAWIARTEIAA